MGVVYIWHHENTESLVRSGGTLPRIISWDCQCNFRIVGYSNTGERSQDNPGSDCQGGKQCLVLYMAR